MGSDIGRQRVRNSRLVGSSFKSPAEVVRWHLAMQSQDYGPAGWSIAQRASGLKTSDIDAALAEGSIIRTHVMRPTWHFVAAEDLRWLMALTGPRVQKQVAGRYRELGLDAKTRARCEKIIAGALEGGNHLTRAELGEALEKKKIDTEGQRLPHILSHCELETMICSGALKGKKHSYALVDERVPDARRFDRDEALIELVRRYLESHGPATVHDLRWWSGLTVSDIKKALEALGADVESRTVDGITLWSCPAETPSSPRGPVVHLLQTYDEVIVGYTESRFFSDPREEVARAAWRDRSVPTGLALLNGSVFGHWKRTMGKRSVAVEVLTYNEPAAAQHKALARAAKELGDFLGMPAELHTALI